MTKTAFTFAVAWWVVVHRKLSTYLHYRHDLHFLFGQHSFLTDILCFQLFVIYLAADMSICT